MEPRNRVVSQPLRCSRGAGGGGRSLPTAGRGEVRVRVLASSLNYTEVLIRRHLYPQTIRLRPPFVMGYDDVVGEIDQIGDGVRNFQIGERVADMTVVGSNSDYRTLRADDVARVPVGLDAAEAATLILSWTTAYQLLHRSARVQRGQRVLVHGAAGAVGQALLVLGRLAGLELWGTARGEHMALVRELGATPIDYQREDFTRVLLGGFDVTVDGIGEDGYRRSYAALKRGGLLCAIGFSASLQAQRRMLPIVIEIARNELASRITGLRLEPDSLALRELLVEISLAERWFENPRAGQEGCPRRRRSLVRTIWQKLKSSYPLTNPTWPTSPTKPRPQRRGKQCHCTYFQGEAAAINYASDRNLADHVRTNSTENSDRRVLNAERLRSQSCQRHRDRINIYKPDHRGTGNGPDAAKPLADNPPHHDHRAKK